MFTARAVFASFSLLLCLQTLVETELIEKCAPVGDYPGCVCQLSGGLVNLTSLANANGSPRFTNVRGPGGSTYSYNPCYGFTASTECDSVAGCQNMALSTGGIGTEAMYVFNGDQPAFLFYTNGTSGNQMQVRLHCNQSQEVPIFLASGDLNHESLYVFDLYSKCVCPGGCDTTSPSTTPTTSPSTTPTTPSSPASFSDAWIVGIILLSLLGLCLLVVAFVVIAACCCYKKTPDSTLKVKATSSSDDDEMKASLLQSPAT